MTSVLNMLEGTRARDAFALRAVMSAPWSILVAPESPLTLLAGVKSSFWLLSDANSPDHSAPIEIRPGDIAITRAETRYIIADTPERAPTVTIFRGQDCRDNDGNSVSESMLHGVRTWGNDMQGDTVFAVAAYENLSRTSDRLNAVLPPVLVITREEWRSPLVDLLCEEMVRDEEGQAAVLDRLVDLALTSALKAWVSRPDTASAPAWKSDGDPVVTRALRLLYAEPAQPWTIESLSDRCHVSRATLARRFRQVVGEPPITFLTNHRMALAADLLQRRGQTLATIAAQVGYTDPFAFSVAFKRNRGASPSDFRAAAAGGGGI